MLAPLGLHVPQFTYADANIQDDSAEQNDSRPFAFSELFQSSVGSSPAISILRDVATPRPSVDDTTAAFIGFSWGPAIDAFPDVAPPVALPAQMTPARNRLSPAGLCTAAPFLLSTPVTNTLHFSTPMRPANQTPFQTLSRNSTARRATIRRPVSDREAMKQLVNCVGMSARKRVMESGRKPRILSSLSLNRTNSFKKELRFHQTPDDPAQMPLSGTDTEEDTDMDTDAPPSPSPSPRPSSAMSRRSGTSTGTFSRIMIGDLSQRTGTDASMRMGGESSRRTSVDLSGAYIPSSLRHPTRETPFDDLQAKHMSLMRSIRTLEQQLQGFASSLEDQ